MSPDLSSALERQIRDLEALARSGGHNLDAEIEPLRARLQSLRDEKAASEKIAEKKNERWARVQLARAPGRPTALDYIERLCSDFVELHGDRTFADDPALIGGPARWQGRPVMLIAHQKGRDLKSRVRRRFGSPNPEGYRKAARLMNLADKFGLPLVALIDTQGAYPGIEAEERGQGWAIAESIQRMVRLKVPAVCAVIGEGGSGGALAIGIGNRVIMQENAWYSVISPEGCASIVWRDAAKAPEAAEALQLTAPDLLRQGLIEAVVPEPEGGAHTDPEAAAELLGAAVSQQLDELSGLSAEELLRGRAERFRHMGVYAQE